MAFMPVPTLTMLPRVPIIYRNIVHPPQHLFQAQKHYTHSYYLEPPFISSTLTARDTPRPSTYLFIYKAIETFTPSRLLASSPIGCP